MKKIHLAYLVSRYPAISHTFILREINTLNKLGIDIAVASVNAPDRDDAQLTDTEKTAKNSSFYIKKAGIVGALRAHTRAITTRPIDYLKGLIFALRLDGSHLKRTLYNFFYFVEAVMVGEWMQAQQRDHLHVHFATESSNIGLILAHTYPITYSLTVHGPDEFYGAKYFHLPEKIAAARFVCCISHFAKSQLMMQSPSEMWHKFERSPLGVDPAVFQPRPHPNNEVTELLCVGRIVPVKGQFVLVNAVRELVQQGKKLHLTLVGDGVDKQALEQYVQQEKLTDFITFTGAVNQDHILDFYKKADIFILASFAEGVPVVLMEAMIMEIPCITTRITGIPELIRAHEQEGILVTPADQQELGEAITRLIDDPALRQTMGEKGRQRVLEAYELEKNTQGLANIFHQHLANEDTTTESEMECKTC